MFILYFKLFINDTEIVYVTPLRRTLASSAWFSGRTSVLGRRAFAVLSLSYFLGRYVILSGSINE